jgi:hypothetical protein
MKLTNRKLSIYGEVYGSPIFLSPTISNFMYEDLHPIIIHYFFPTLYANVNKSLNAINLNWGN